MRVLMSLLGSAALSAAGSGQVIEWDAGVDGAWGDPARWSPMNVPNVAGETARIDVAGSYVVTMSAPDDPTIDAIELTNVDARLDLRSGAILTLLGDSVNDGLIVINSNANPEDAVLEVIASLVLDGSGEVRLNRFGNDARIRTVGDDVTLEVGAAQTITGFGAIEGSIVNAGTIEANVGGSALEIRLGTMINHGLLAATGDGVLEIEQSVEQSGGAEIRGDGGIVRFPLGTDATVTGGVFDSSGEGAIEKGSSGTLTLDDVTNLGRLDIVSGGFVVVVGDLVNEGSVVVNSNEAGSDSALDFVESGTISGAGEIRVTRPGNDSRVRTVGDDVELTIGPDHVVRGWGAIEGTFVNQGTVIADRPGEELQIRFGSMANDGLLMATATGILEIEQLVDQSGGGQIVADAATVLFPTSTSATIVGGLIDSINGGEVVKGASGALTLDGVAVDTDVSVIAGGTVEIAGGGIQNNGLLLVNSNAAGADAIVEAVATTSIDGDGEIRLNKAGNDARLRSIGGGTLTVGAGQTITGSGSLDGDLVIEGVLSPGTPGTDETETTAMNSGLLTLSEASVLEIDLGGTGPGLFDRLAGTSDIALAGSLEVALVDGYEPALGDAFVIIDASGVLGAFDSITLPALPGNLRFVLKQGDGEVTLLATCPGDCTVDGIRNILDFVCFQELFVAGDPLADCDANGTLNILDFVCFQVSFQSRCP